MRKQNSPQIIISIFLSNLSDAAVSNNSSMSQSSHLLLFLIQPFSFSCRIVWTLKPELFISFSALKCQTRWPCLAYDFLILTSNSNQSCECTDLFGISCFLLLPHQDQAPCFSLLWHSQHIHLSTTSFSVFSREASSLVILRCHAKFSFCWHFPDFLGFKAFWNEVLKQMMTMCFYAYITHNRVIPDSSPASHGNKIKQ